MKYFWPKNSLIVGMILSLLLVTAVASAATTNLDMQTGNFSQWAAVQDTPHMGASSVGSHTLLSVIQPAGAPLRYAADAHVWADSTGNPANKSRAELLAPATAKIAAGATLTVSYKFLLPSGSTNSCEPAWQLYTQFSTGGAYDTPNLQDNNIGGVRHLILAMDNGTLAAPNQATADDLGPIQWDHWYTVTMVVKGGRTASTGHITLTLDGVQKVNRADQTMPSDSGAGTLKQGIYQHDSGCSGEEYIQGTTVS